MGSNKNILATLDVAAEKDLTKRRAVLKKLAEHSGLVSSADLAAFDKAHLNETGFFAVCL